MPVKNQLQQVTLGRKFIKTEIPENWELLQLGNLGKVHGRIGWKNLRADEYAESGPLMLSVWSLIDQAPYGVDYEVGTHRLSQFRYDESPEIQLQNNDVLLAKDGDIGRVGFVKELPELSTVNSHVVVIRVKNSVIYSEYLYWFMKSKPFQTYCIAFTSGTTVPLLTQKDLRDVMIPIPSIPEQQKIISILSNVDSLIKQTQNEIEQTQKLKKGLMQKLFTKGIGHTKFKKIKWLFGKEIEIPTTWIKTTVSEVFQLRTGSTPSRTNPDYFVGDIPWVTSTDLNRGIVNKTLEKISQEAKDKTRLKIFPKGTFVIATYGLEAAGTRGKCGILDFDATINQACMAFIPSEKMIVEFFFYFYLEFGERIAFNYCQGTKQQNLYPDTVKRIPLILPSLQEQQKIASILSNVDSQIMHKQECKSKLENLKKGLMQKLLTGQIRVKV